MVNLHAKVPNHLCRKVWQKDATRAATAICTVFFFKCTLVHLETGIQQEGRGGITKWKPIKRGERRERALISSFSPTTVQFPGSDLLTIFFHQLLPHAAITPAPLFSPDTNHHQPRPSLSINSLSPSLSRPIPNSVSYIVDRSRGMDGRFGSCFEESIREQDADLNELVEAMQSERRESEAELRELVEKSMRHYEEYSEKRRELAREDGSIFLCPPWNTAFENSFLWLGGCRPSLVIRLIYALSGSELAAHLDEFLAPGGGSTALRGGLVGLSASQLALVNELHRWTVKEEDKLSTKMATLQEDLGDIPLLTIVKDWGRGTAAAPTGERNGWNEEVKAVMEELAEKLGRKVVEADELRVATTRKLMTEILTPLQAVQLLVAAKQLHLAIRNWSQRWDLYHLRRG